MNFSFKTIRDIYTEEGQVSDKFTFLTEPEMGHYISDKEVKLTRKWIKKHMQLLKKQISFEDDAYLAKASSSADLKAAQQPQMALFNAIIPLKITELVSDHFKQVLEQNKNEVHLNVFIVGYSCDQGVRACGGRSGTELGPNVFRGLLQSENQQQFDELARQLKKHKAVLYDLGDIKKYQLTKYLRGGKGAYAKGQTATIGDHKFFPEREAAK